jgi:hypothetical protein
VGDPSPIPAYLKQLYPTGIGLTIPSTLISSRRRASDNIYRFIVPISGNTARHVRSTVCAFYDKVAFKKIGEPWAINLARFKFPHLVSQAFSEDTVVNGDSLCA